MNGPLTDPAFQILDHIPQGLLDVPARRLHEVLRGPSLTHLPGRREEALFVSVLLHGNEDTGLLAVQALLSKYADQPLPRAMSIFIGNVTAAREGLRRLDGQPDYNRVWPGAEDDGTAEHAMMRKVVDEMRGRPLFASVDIHNNTGLNPHYACVNRLDHRFFHLATLFGRVVVYFIRPRGVQSAAFAELCPSVTVECGKPGDAQGVAHALQYLEACLHLVDFPEHPVARHDMDLFHTVAVVKVPPAVRFGFGDVEASGLDLSFDPDLDHMNFRELPMATPFGRLGSPQARLDVRNEAGDDAGDRYFDYRDGIIRTRRVVMPSMLTRDERVIRQDCLCYLMERLSHEEITDGRR